MDLTSYQKILDGARKYYGSRKPEFAYRNKPTNVGDRKRIVLPDVDGTYPIDPTKRDFTFLTARAWGERCFFWTQDVGTRRCIVDRRGRCPVKLNANRSKLLVTYHEWLGVEQLGVRDGFGRQVMAFNLPSSDTLATLPSPQPTVPEPGYDSDTSNFCSSEDEYLTDSPGSPLDSKTPCLLRASRSRTALRRAQAPCESPRTGSRGTGELVVAYGHSHKGSAQSKHRNKRRRTAPKDDKTMKVVAIPTKEKSKAPPNTLAKGIKPAWGLKPLTRQRQEIPESDGEGVVPPRGRREGSVISSSSTKPSSPGTVVDESDEIPSNNVRVPHHRRSISTSFERWSRSLEIPAASRRK